MKRSYVTSLAFLAAGLLWGTSFLWIKIALREIGPFPLVTYRLAFGAIGMLALFLLKKARLPRDGKTVRGLLVMSLLNPGIAFFFISWSETRIASGETAILNGTVPLVTIVLAHFLLHDEKITLSRVLGLLAGFAGVVVLVAGDLSSSSLRSGLLGKGAVLLAAMLYGLSGVHSRRNLRGISPVLQATAVTVLSDLWYWIAILGTGNALPVPHLAMTWVALAWLGLLGTCTAFLCFFYVLNAWGATRASLVNFLFPLVGVLMGIAFGNEHAGWRLVSGAALILSGILLVNAPALRYVPYGRRHPTCTR